MKFQILVLGTVLTTIVSLSAQTSGVEIDLQRAKQLEAASGDCKAVLPEYSRIAEQAAKSSRPVAAEALLRAGICHDRLADGLAATVFGRIIREFADQSVIANEARKRLPPSAPPAVAAARDLPLGPFQSRVLDLFIASGDFLSGTAFDFSPDGTKVVHGKSVASPKQRTNLLVVRDLTTGDERTLATLIAGYVTAVRFSPDGQHVAARTQVGSDRIEERLIIAAVTGTRPPTTLPWSTMNRDEFYRLRDQEGWQNIRWSPDGKSLAHLSPLPDGRLEAGIFDVSAGTSRSVGVVVEGSSPDFVWSADGDRLAVRVTNAAMDRHEIRVVSVRTSAVSTLSLPAVDGKRYRVTAWPDPDGIVVRQLTKTAPLTGTDYMVSIRTGQLTSICETQGGRTLEDERPFGSTGVWRNVDLCLGVTKDGTSQLLWKASAERLFVRNLATGADVPLTRGSGEEGYAYLSPAQSTVVFASNRNGRWALYAARADRAPVANPVLLQQLGGRPSGLLLHWTRDGFVSRIVSGEANVVNVAMDRTTGRASGGAERLTQDYTDNLTPAISPDSQSIAYWNDRGLALMDAQGARERVVVDRPANAIGHSPEWRSADEVVTAIRRPGPASTQAFYVQNIRTGAAREVPGGPIEKAALAGAWDYVRSQDAVFYLTPGSAPSAFVFRARSIADGTDRAIATVDTAGSRIYSFQASPDGRRIAYSMFRGNGPTTHDLNLLTIETGDVRNLTKPVNYVTINGWSPDGRFLLYGPARPRILDVTTGTSWPLLEGADALSWGEEGEAEGNGDWSPDGSFVVFATETVVRQWRQWIGVTADAVGRLGDRR